MKKVSEIQILGAREHNLKNFDLAIPRNQLTVITGLSGSGKSSLAFDTIFKEGQRRYLETVSAYARHFVGTIERPDVDKITGLSPVISIEQKTTIKNPRSTVGTVTDIYDFLRLLFARASEAFSYETGEKMVKYTNEQILSLILDQFDQQPVYILSPLVKGRKGHYRELFEQLRRKGFLNVRINGKLKEITKGMKVDRYKTHFIELVVDKTKVDKKDTKRLKESVKTALEQGSGILMILDKETGVERYYSKKLMCPTTGISYNEPAPHTFSFNSPRGACPKCKGLGVIKDVALEKIIPDMDKTVKNGAIQPLGQYHNALVFWQIESILKKYNATLNTKAKNIPKEALDIILFGSEQLFRIESSPLGKTANYYLSFDGILNYLNNKQLKTRGRKPEQAAHNFIKTITCPTCNGDRLHKEALYFRIAGKNIAELANMDLIDLYAWFESVESQLNNRQKQIAAEIFKEMRSRLKFLLDVGLDYLTLDRQAKSLSGGESQRIRLATQIGSQLVNVLYILDEPSIGLHHRDNRRLINSLKQLRDMGNTVIVVEHDKDMILAADHLIDIGPLAGKYGGEIIAQGIPDKVKEMDSLTGKYLSNRKTISVPKKRRQGNGKELKIIGATGNNLKDVSVIIPLGKMNCITGVSGSGKSSLINMTLYPALSNKIFHGNKEVLPYKSMQGLEHIDKVIEVDQTLIGSTPRSNAATYTGLFTEIRKLFEQMPEARIRGYKANRFSFNVKGGRCETCKGAGVQTIEMNFLPDVYVTCKDCEGKRYNRETLEVTYKGKNINDVLNLTVNQAVDFFQSIPKIHKKLLTLQEVGLGYIKTGQPSTTLSGGESQRVKLASELSKKSTGKTIYILDEPTTGLHFEDVKILLGVVNQLVDKGNTVIIIEHNMEVIKVADHVIDLGQEGGRHGGRIIATGTPEEVAKVSESYTGRGLAEELKTGVKVL